MNAKEVQCTELWYFKHSPDWLRFILGLLSSLGTTTQFELLSIITETLSLTCHNFAKVQLCQSQMTQANSIISIPEGHSLQAHLNLAICVCACACYPCGFCMCFYITLEVSGWLKKIYKKPERMITQGYYKIIICVSGKWKGSSRCGWEF